MQPLSVACSLGDGHDGVHILITQNVHLANFIGTLNKIKAITGLYTIVSGKKYDWLQYDGGHTILQELVIAPNKTTITLPLTQFWLNNGQLNGQSRKVMTRLNTGYLSQTHFLALKLMQMSREYLGKSIQLFSGHGWWKKTP